ncbi:copia-like envelope protein [Autographa californica nucleopolyhedrovirus]|uniref:Protein AC23 n=2 Tax=Autographa californica nuclear polyhedrosis virus TaxID=46015 RepID=AC23_NPVAC|nr:copia-like envelope protein [Autographa californica nucleopolyhedrovirus]P41428.1 RecName: Full=Protein AC23; AltName: Full=ORF 9; Flags: Precursor [Autographa californica nucleopolyhedrovirus]AKN58875.1 copia-like envelope protein [Autographa californica multiple nucleopolyhedrovirus]ARJ58708.1 copia-like envelope protein [synthetic baculovirus AcMNPV-WIV-Syn1]UVY87288.1 fusion protein [synthetic construct]AAA66653.1 copia-like envelope protein [Autographa californica nucleopolyhedrovirus]
MLACKFSQYQAFIMDGVKLLGTCALIILLSTTSTVVGRDRITFTPIEDSAGLMFERMYGLRHHTDDRFVFVKKFNFVSVLQELNNIKSKIELYEAQVSTCTNVRQIKQNRSSIIKARIENQLQFLTQLNKNLITYSVESSILSNDVLDNIDLEYDDSGEFDVYDEYEQPSHWSNMTVSDAQALLRNPPKDRVMFLDTVTTSDVSSKYEEYINCIVSNRTVENECMFLANMMNVLNDKLDDAAALAKMLERIVKQTRKNKLNISNTVIDDDTLLTEMKKLTQTLYNQNRVWVVDFNKDMNSYFDLSQAYKLHLYVDLNTVIMFITMPLLKSTAVSFNLYRVMTVPFCRGKMCLLIISGNEYFGITDSKNYYVPVSDNFRQDCQEFTGYNEFLCPETEPIATMNSKVCEIEMFMGRYSDDVDNMCDIRVANYNPKKAYVNTLIDYRKWLYIFPNTTVSVHYYCHDALVEVDTKVSPGVGVMFSTMAQTCSIRITYDVTITVDSRFYVSHSTTYWPKKKFNFNNYIDQMLLEKATTSFIPTVDNFTRPVLLQLPHKFHIKDYTSTPHHFFHQSKIYTNSAAPDEDSQDDSNTTVVIIAIVAAMILFCGLLLFLFCCIKKRCHQSNNVVVQYKNNNEFVTICNNLEDNRAYINLPNEYDSDDMPKPLYPLLGFNDDLLKDDKPVLYPMIIERIK